MTRSATAFARGARTGVSRVSTPTASARLAKSPPKTASRSRSAGREGLLVYDHPAGIAPIRTVGSPGQWAAGQMRPLPAAAEPPGEALVGAAVVFDRAVR